MDAQSTRRKPEDTRRQIIDMAIEIAADQGAMGVTLDAVVARLPFSKGALLHHFPNKLALLKGVIDHLASEMTAAVLGAIRGADLTIALWSVGQMLLNMYLTLFILGAITTVTEWRRIHTKAVKKVIYAFTFPLFMFTYIPISFAAFFCKGEWKPIEHRVSAASLRGRGREELLPF